MNTKPIKCIEGGTVMCELMSIVVKRLENSELRFTSYKLLVTGSLGLLFGGAFGWNMLSKFLMDKPVYHKLTKTQLVFRDLDLAIWCPNIAKLEKVFKELGLERISKSDEIEGNSWCMAVPCNDKTYYVDISLRRITYDEPGSYTFHEIPCESTLHILSKKQEILSKRINNLRVNGNSLKLLERIKSSSTQLKVIAFENYFKLHN